MGLFNNYNTHCGWVGLTVFRDGKQGGERYFMKGRHVTVEKIKKVFFFVPLQRDRDFIVKRSGFH